MTLRIFIYLIFFCAILLIFSTKLNAQIAPVNSRVIGVAGYYSGNQSFQINATVGEAIIFGQSASGIYVGQGFQTNYPSMITTSITRFNRERITLQVYPNPFSNELFLGGNVLPEIIEIYNLRGQCLGRIQSPSHHIVEWRELPLGVYLLRAAYSDQYFTIGKIIKINP
jgi:hypothetical protein